jgi:hypothetical protein
MSTKGTKIFIKFVQGRRDFKFERTVFDSWLDYRPFPVAHFSSIRVLGLHLSLISIASRLLHHFYLFILYPLNASRAHGSLQQPIMPITIDVSIAPQNFTSFPVVIHEEEPKISAAQRKARKVFEPYMPEQLRAQYYSEGPHGNVYAMTFFQGPIERGMLSAELLEGLWLYDGERFLNHS